MKIIGASIGECVHIQGVYNALEYASRRGHETHFLGPALNADQLIQTIKTERPDAVALSYRLTPENGRRVMDQFIERLTAEGLTDIDYLFGGTEPVVEQANQTNFFTLVVDGSNVQEYESYLGEANSDEQKTPAQNIVSRIKEQNFYPLLRTHYGNPSVDQTIKGIESISESGLLDIISLGTDQDAQANFFHPERQNPNAKGAGGVPVRSAQDFRRLFEATRRGNYPLMRTYAGTDDLVELAELYKETINNAWSAVPIFWFNQMDGRGPHSLEESIQEHFNLIKWNAENNIPVEILESHHWGMRLAHNTLQVATAVLGAQIAKTLGVKNYIHQYMFHLPPQSSFYSELAKMTAIKEMLQEMEGDDFKIYHQIRAGLPSFPHDMEAARGQLASSTQLQMQLSPDIIHVVNFSEPHHAATAEDVIASAKIVNQVIDNSRNPPDATQEIRVKTTREQLQIDARTLLNHIHSHGDISDPTYLASLVYDGVLDAPMLANNPFARGQLRTTSFGISTAIDKDGLTITEQERLEALK